MLPGRPRQERRKGEMVGAWFEEKMRNKKSCRSGHGGKEIKKEVEARVEVGLSEQRDVEG